MSEEPAAAIGPTTCREFGVTDGMILTAGAALAMAEGPHLAVLMARTFGNLWSSAIAHRDDLPDNWPVFWGATHDDLRNTIWYGSQVLSSILFGLTPASLAVRLRRPRPPWRALLRQPGFVAGLAMVAGLFYGTGLLATLFPGRFDGFSAAPSAIGGGVALGWGLLALRRRWAPERCWIDRLGRVLGWSAIGLATLGPLIRRI